MRIAIATTWLVLCGVASADDEPTIGPYASIREVCNAEVARIVKAQREEATAARDYTCRLLDRRSDYAVLLVDDRSQQPFDRHYAVVLRERGVWWAPDHAWLSVVRDGDAYLAGNCCYGRAGTPTYDLEAYDRRGTRLVVLRVDLPLQRFYKKGWGPAPADDPAFRPYYRSEAVACWRHADAGFHCKALLFVNCPVPERPSVTVRDLAIESRCRSNHGANRVDLEK